MKLVFTSYFLSQFKTQVWVSDSQQLSSVITLYEEKDKGVLRTVLITTRSSSFPVVVYDFPLSQEENENTTPILTPRLIRSAHNDHGLTDYY